MKDGLKTRTLANVSCHQQTLSRAFRGIAILMMLAIIIFGGFAFLIPLEVVQQWAVNRAGTDPFKRFEAIGGAELSIWLWRTLALLTGVIFAFVLTDWDRWFAWSVNVYLGLRETTRPQSSGPNNSIGMRFRTAGFRTILLLWSILFIGHGIAALGQCHREWPYFRLNSGQVVLPNISEGNRAVIRFIQQATPPDARILVFSDQKLFFLSYYLRPRTLLHRMHPESEHVIPLKDQERRLNAYRLEDLSESDLQQMPHDYILEYFEHPDLVDRSKVLSDQNWITFLRGYQRNPNVIPEYEVQLRRVNEGQP